MSMLMRLQPWNKKNKVKALKVIINVDVSAAVEYKPPIVKKRKAGFQAAVISYLSFWHLAKTVCKSFNVSVRHCLLSWNIYCPLQSFYLVW